MVLGLLERGGGEELSARMHGGNGSDCVPDPAAYREER